MSDKEQFDQALAEFLANGGVIQQCGPFESGRTDGEGYSAWGKPKKRKGEEPTLEPEDDSL
jgi:hypothetical protein